MNLYKKSALLLIFILTITSLVNATTLRDSLVVTGRVQDTQGNNLPVVIVEQKSSLNYVFTASDGTFQLTLLPDFSNSLRVSLVGYNERIIEVNKKENKPLRIILEPQDTLELARAKHRKHPVTSLSTSLGYSFLKSDFSNYTELETLQRQPLNKLMHFIGFDLNSYIYNIFLNLNFDFTPTGKSHDSNHRHYTDATQIGIKLGYGFRFLENRFIVTPYLGATYLGYSLTTAPTMSKVALENYLELSSKNLLFKQYVGNVGATVDFRLLEISRRQGLYLSAHLGFIGKLHSNAIIRAKGVIISSPHQMQIFPIETGISLRYVFYTYHHHRFSFDTKKAKNK